MREKMLGMSGTSLEEKQPLMIKNVKVYCNDGVEHRDLNEAEYHQLRQHGRNTKVNQMWHQPNQVVNLPWTPSH